MKTCTKCNETLSVNYFRKRKASTDGYHTQCKMCLDANSERHRLMNIEKRRMQDRARSLKHKFGITLEQYAELLKKQDNKCAICRKHRDEFKINFAVDHNHETREIRGLLCYHCNHRVVGRHKDGELLRRVADYIEQGTGWFAPQRKRPVKRKPKRK